MSHPSADNSEDSPHGAQGSQLRNKCQHIDHVSLHEDVVDANCQDQNCNASLELKIHLSDCNIHAFPVEILSIVFTLYAASDDHKIRSKWWHASPSPVILTSICRKWRRIALDLPHIWTKVTINPWKHVFSLDLTTDLLSRSRSLPLSLTIQGSKTTSGASKPPSGRPLENLFQILRSLSGRWEELILKTPEHLIQHLLHGLERVHALDVLRMGSDAGRMYYTWPVVAGLGVKTRFAPKRFFATGNVFLARTMLEWSRLTHLEVKDMSVDDLVHIFENATSLETCIADDIRYPSMDYPLPDLPVTNHSLKSLDTHDFCDFSDFIPYVTFPALETLIYEISGPYVEVNRLANFLDRSKPCLKYFSILYHTGEAMDHEGWFHIFPTVTRLELVVNENVEHFIYQLTPSVFPKLQELRIITSSISYEGWQRLTKIFLYDNDKESQNKTRAKRPLASFYIRLTTSPTEEPIPEEVHARFVKIQASGVRVEVVGANQVDLLKISAKLYEHGAGEEHNSVG